MAFHHVYFLFFSFLLVAITDAYTLPTPAPEAPNLPVTPNAPPPKLAALPTPTPVKSYSPPPQAATPPVKAYAPPPKAPSPPVSVVAPYPPKAPAVAPYPPKAPAVGPYPPKAPSPVVAPYPPKAPTPPLVKPPSPAPYYGKLPPVKKEECVPLCEKRCSLHSRKRLCVRACSTCCERCKCVPPGTYGNKEVCGRCYTEMTTHGGRLKCP